MTSNKKPDFLSQLSKNRLNDLKKKLAKDRNESCAISTINELLQNPLAVPKQNNSLRSLRSKPCRPPPPPPDSIPTVPEVTSSSMDFGVAPDLRKELEFQNEINQPSNIGNNESVFAVPTMRAPRTVKNGNSNLLDRSSKAATMAFMILDNATIDKLLLLSITNVLAMIESCSPGTSEIENVSNCEVLQLLNELLQNLAEGIEEEGGNPDYPDMDNMTSVSGYPPYHQTYMNQFGNQTTFAPGIGQPLPMFMRHTAGSTVGSSIYQPRNDTFMNQSFTRPITQGAGRMLPNFLNSTASMVGSMYDHPLMNQTSFMHNKPLFGYQPHPMSVRTEASMYRPLRDVHSNSSTIMNHGAYPQNPQARVRENLSMSYNTGNMHQVPSVVGGNSRMNYAGEDEENMYRSSGRDQLLEKVRQSNRKMLSPLLPVVELQRLEPEAIQQSSNLPDTTLKTIKTTTYTVQKLKDSIGASNIQKTASLLNNTAMRSATRLRQGLSSTGVTPLQEKNFNDSRVTRVTRSGRAVRAPQTFWASEISSITQHNQTVQMRGTKRKRCI